MQFLAEVWQDPVNLVFLPEILPCGLMAPRVMFRTGDGYLLCGIAEGYAVAAMGPKYWQICLHCPLVAMACAGINIRLFVIVIAATKLLAIP